MCYNSSSSGLKTCNCSFQNIKVHIKTSQSLPGFRSDKVNSNSESGKLVVVNVQVSHQMLQLQTRVVDGVDPGLLKASWIRIGAAEHVPGSWIVVSEPFAIDWLLHNYRVGGAGSCCVLAAFWDGHRVDPGHGWNGDVQITVDGVEDSRRVVHSMADVREIHWHRFSKLLTVIKVCYVYVTSGITGAMIKA